MNKTLLIACLLAAFGLVAAPVMAGDIGNDQCVTCHQEQADNPIEAHQTCMDCHAGGAEEHIDNFRTHPDPVTNETCETCHKPTEEFLEISAHTMDMECSACHTIHED